MNRLTCICGADLGDASDPYADPDCVHCIEVAVDLDDALESAANALVPCEVLEPTTSTKKRRL